MYNRYVPADAEYTRVAEEEVPRQEKRPPAGEGLGGLVQSLGEGLGSLKGGLGGLLKGVLTEDLDLGDVLLALIVLLILLEDGDGLDVAITLGLMLLFSLGETSCEGPDRREG